MRGNVVDMAVGVVIGTAFGKIVSSIVSDLIMPLIGVICGGVNFTDLSITLKEAQVVDGQEQAAVLLNYGNFLQATFDFIIIAFSIFVFTAHGNPRLAEEAGKMMSAGHLQQNGCVKSKWVFPALTL